MAQQTKTHTLRKLLSGVLVLVFWVAVWQLAAMRIGREVVLPAPLSVCRRFFELLPTRAFWTATALSLVRIMSGYLLGVLCGTLLGLAMYFAKPLRALFSPLLTVIKSTPVASFILLALVMIRNAVIPTCITFLMVLPMMASCVLSALASTDKALLEMTEVYCFSFWKKLRYLYLPTVRPHVVGQALTALGFAWKAGVAAEVLCTPRSSIGKYLYESKVYLETVDLFAYTLLIVLISLALEWLLRRLLHKTGGNAA